VRHERIRSIAIHPHLTFFERSAMTSVAAAKPTLSPLPPSLPIDVLMHEEGDPSSLMELAVIPINDGTKKECTFQYEGRPCQLCKDEPIPDDFDVLQVPTKDNVVVLDLTCASLSLLSTLVRQQLQQQDVLLLLLLLLRQLASSGDDASMTSQQGEGGVSTLCVNLFLFLDESQSCS
jgi:hypothetical protein